MSETYPVAQDIRHLSRNLVALLRTVGDVEREENAASDVGEELRPVATHLEKLILSKSFGMVLERTQSGNRQSLAWALDELIALFPVSGEISPDFLLNLQAVLIPRLLDIGRLVMDLLQFDHGLEPQIASDFRAKVNSLVKAISAFSGEHSLYDSVQYMQQNLAQSQKETNLLRAQLQTNQTELEIREEQARAAELRAKQLSGEVKRLDVAISELDARVAVYASTEGYLDELIKSAVVEKAEITRIRDEVQVLAADAGDNVMAGSYGAMAKDHAKKERIFRRIAFGFFAVSAVGAALIAWNISWFGAPDTAGSSPGEFWSIASRKLLVAGGFAAIGFYFSRLASHHRKIEVWSSSLGVQLKTLESYLGGIKGDDVKDAIREKFAALTFGGPPELKSTSTNTKIPDAKAMTELATALTTALRQ